MRNAYGVLTHSSAVVPACISASMPRDEGAKKLTWVQITGLHLVDLGIEFYLLAGSSEANGRTKRRRVPPSARRAADAS